jgi:hypothetical protein
MSRLWAICGGVAALFAVIGGSWAFDEIYARNVRVAALEARFELQLLYDEKLIVRKQVSRLYEKYGEPANMPQGVRDELLIWKLKLEEIDNKIERLKKGEKSK